MNKIIFCTLKGISLLFGKFLLQSTNNAGEMLLYLCRWLCAYVQFVKTENQCSGDDHPFQIIIHFDSSCKYCHT